MWNGYPQYMSPGGGMYYGGGGGYMGSPRNPNLNLPLPNGFLNHFENTSFDFNRVPMRHGGSPMMSPPNARMLGFQHTQNLKEWSPDTSIKGNHWPYPKNQLQNARQTLIQTLKDKQSLTLQRLKPSFGLDSIFGTAQMLPPLNGDPSASQNIGDSDNSWHITYDEKKQLHPRCPRRGSRFEERRESSSSPEPQTKPATPLSDHYELPLFEGASADDSGIFDAPPSYSETSNPKDSVSSPKTQVSSPESISRSSSKSLDGSRQTSKSPHATSTVTSPVSSTVTKMDTSIEKRAADQQDLTPGAKRQRLLSDNDSLLPATKQTTLIYKCDFCNFVSSHLSAIDQHLVNAKHYSGSLYNSHYGKMVSIEKMLVAKNKHSITKTLVVVCPDCQELFEDIFMCAMHHKYLHGSEAGLYSICPVIYHETVSFSVKPTCSTCNETFEKHKLLHSHWNSLPEHHPVKKPATSNVFVLHICPYCSKIFYNNLLMCKTHVLAHQKTSVNKQHFAVEVKHILQPLRKLELPPFNTEGKDGLQNELTILNNMHKFYLNMGGTKHKARQLMERIQTLQCFSLKHQQYMYTHS